MPNAICSLLFIELYPDVSILVARIMNYELITQLDVLEILEVLNEICVRLDGSATSHNVLPIKFVGNIFSCVAGVTQNTVRHTNACVDLAFDMINLIEEISKSKKLDIGLRTAVHNGEAFTAIVGRKKCCFDIWSKDVAIVQCMESLGRQNMVHLSQKALNSLHNEYIYEDGPIAAQKNSLLQKAKISTYLIGPQPRVLKGIGGNYLLNIGNDSATSSQTSLKRQSGPSASSIAEFNCFDDLPQKTAKCLLEKMECMPVDSIQ